MKNGHQATHNHKLVDTVIVLQSTAELAEIQTPSRDNRFGVKFTDAALAENITQRMDLVAFPFQQRPCPKCASPVDSAIVDARDPGSRGTSFVFYDCIVCGQLVYRILQFNIATSNRGNSLLLGRVDSDELIEEVIRASVGAP